MLGGGHSAAPDRSKASVRAAEPPRRLASDLCCVVVVHRPSESSFGLMFLRCLPNDLSE
jgi:hypothetical protein